MSWLTSPSSDSCPHLHVANLLSPSRGANIISIHEMCYYGALDVAFKSHMRSFRLTQKQQQKNVSKYENKQSQVTQLLALNNTSLWPVHLQIMILFGSKPHVTSQCLSHGHAWLQFPQIAKNTCFAIQVESLSPHLRSEETPTKFNGIYLSLYKTAA